MQYIADSIGTEFQDWRERDTIFISSPTGTGKTTFILKIYLPYLVTQGKKLLYLVNRTILKDQLEKEISKLPAEQRLSIDIELYQTIEQKMLFYDQKIRERYGRYDCVVCDEAHYFLTDSNYNTNTILSYYFVRDNFEGKIRIYISATIDKIKAYVENDNNQQIFCRTRWFGLHRDDTNRFKIFNKPRKAHEYSADKDYNYVDVKVLRSRNEIIKTVCDEKEKWLIFVDNKEYGEKLNKDIKKYFSNSNENFGDNLVTFISSEYKSDPQSKEQVGEIVESKKASVKILIATSVLDNGISIQDIELRNIILIADTETEFVQMLGRKRKDGEPLGLYIYAHDKAHFIRRYMHNEEIKKIADQSYRFIEDHLFKFPQDDWSKIDECERNLIRGYHVYLMPRIMNSEKFYRNIRSIFTVIDGVLCLNLLSVQNIENLSLFYNYLIEKFETDGEDAFLKEQLRWLNKTEDEIDKILTEERYGKVEKSRQNIIKAFETIADKDILKEEFIKFKQANKEDFLILVHASTSMGIEDKEKYSDMLKKSDRPISGPFVKEICTEFNIPYAMDVKKKMYTIKKL